VAAVRRDFRYHLPTWTEFTDLSLRRRHWFVVFALIAFLFAQSAALLHELCHATSGTDTSVPASERSPLCKECVSHAPLLVIAGAAAIALFLALPPYRLLQASRTGTVTFTAVRRPFAARAPPRC
jgi:hypothetical protein